MGVEPAPARELLYDVNEAMEEQYDWFPDVTHVTDVELAAMDDVLRFDRDDFTVTLSRDVAWDDDRSETVLESALTHVNWHPNQVWRETQADLSFSMADTETIGDMPGESAATVHRVYHAAVDRFFDANEYDFDIPRLVVDDAVYEEKNAPLTGEEYMPVGYVIEPEPNQFVINADVIDRLHPDVLQNDFQGMLHGYFSTALEHGLKRDINPYVRSLDPGDDLSWTIAKFDELDEGTAQYRNGSGMIQFDTSTKQEFDPVRGRFTTEFPEYARLHEVVHDKDFTNNEATEERSREQLPIPDLKLTEDARNVVFELPTTFETYMAGYRREPVMDVFEEPQKRMSWFFDGYTALNSPNVFRITVEDEDKISYKRGDTVRDPYNFAQFTAIALHRANVEKYGEEQGTERTRDQLYTNDWTTMDVKHVLEDSLDVLDLPNLPRRKRRLHEQYREQDDIEEFAVTTARGIIHQIEQADTGTERLEHGLAGDELLNIYEEEQSFRNPPAELDYLDDLVCDICYGDT